MRATKTRQNRMCRLAIQCGSLFCLLVHFLTKTVNFRPCQKASNFASLAAAVDSQVTRNPEIGSHEFFLKDHRDRVKCIFYDIVSQLLLRL